MVKTVLGIIFLISFCLQPSSAFIYNENGWIDYFLKKEKPINIYRLPKTQMQLYRLYTFSEMKQINKNAKKEADNNNPFSIKFWDIDPRDLTKSSVTATVAVGIE